MPISLSTFNAQDAGCGDGSTAEFALAFEEKSRRAPFFGNILVDAMWSTWKTHQGYPATLANAKDVLDGHDSPYPDSAMAMFRAEQALLAKTALTALMHNWANGNSTVLGYSDEQAISLAYRDMGHEGFFVFFYCSYLDADSIQAAFDSVGVAKNQYQLIETEEERSGSDFLSSMRDNDLTWFETLQRIGLIDEDSIVLGANEDD